MAVREIHIYNTKTGNVRVVDYHEWLEGDPLPQGGETQYKPIMHVDLQVGPDEIVSYRL